MLQIFENIKPLDSAPISLSVTTAALSSTRAGRLCGLYTLSTFIFTCLLKPSPSPSSIAIRRQHHPFCYSQGKLFNAASTRERAKFQQSDYCAFAFLKTVSGFDGHAAASSKAFRRRRATRPRRRQRPSCSTTKRHEAENASNLKVQVATSSQAVRRHCFNS